MATRKRSHKKSRGARQSKDEIKQRQVKVAKLRFVQRWRIDEIAKAVDVNERTIKRDLSAIRKGLRKQAKDNLENEIRDIIEEIRLSFSERVKWLWQQFIELEEQDRKKGKIKSASIRTKQDILKQIQLEESIFIDNLRKLGIGFEHTGEDDLSSILIEVKARRANIVKNNFDTGDADSSKA